MNYYDVFVDVTNTRFLKYREKGINYVTSLQKFWLVVLLSGDS